jgi:hypothetical protein
MPVDIEEYSLDGCNGCFVSIWVTNVEHQAWDIRYNLTGTEFSEKATDMRADGWRIVTAQANYHGDKMIRWAGIWLYDPTDAATIMRKQIPDLETLNEIRAQYEGNGYRPIAYEEYYREGDCGLFGWGCTSTLTYAMIWRRNT